MKRRHLTVLFGMLLLVAGCTGVSQQKHVRPLTSSTAILKTTLRSLDLADPGADLKLNIHNGDYRFIGIYGVVLFAPGLQKGEYPLLAKYGLRALEGTSDAIENQEHGALMLEAGKYAESYNQLLVQWLASKGTP